MRTRVSTLALGLVLGVLVLAGSAEAQTRTNERLGFAVTGVITAIRPETNTLTVKSTNDDGVTYTVTDTTSIMSGATTVKFADLQKGWHVAVNGQTEGDSRVATLIKVVKAP